MRAARVSMFRVQPGAVLKTFVRRTQRVKPPREASIVWNNGGIKLEPGSISFWYSSAVGAGISRLEFGQTVIVFGLSGPAQPLTGQALRQAVGNELVVPNLAAHAEVLLEFCNEVPVGNIGGSPPE